jgi:hypothetical protein
MNRFHHMLIDLLPISSQDYGNCKMFYFQQKLDISWQAWTCWTLLKYQSTGNKTFCRLKTFVKSGFSAYSKQHSGDTA